MNIEDRLSKLEKQNKKLRYMNNISLVLVGMFLITGFQQQFQLPDIIKAKGFILLDDDNKERAVLKIDTIANRNSPKLRFYDENKNIITSIGTNKNEGYLSVHDEASNDTSSVWISGSFISFKHNAEDKIYMGLSSSNKALIKLVDISQYTNDTIKNLMTSMSNELWVNDTIKSNIEINRNNIPMISTTIIELVKQNHRYKLSLFGGLKQLVDEPKLIIRSEDKKPDYFSSDQRLTYYLGYQGNTFGEYFFDTENKLRLSNVIYNYNGYSKILTSYYDDNENLRLSIGNQQLINSNGYEYITPESSINLFNENGNVIEQLPR